jgi:hypothetical protein
MTKIRTPLTIEHILAEVLKKIDVEELKKITGKSISHFRKCSDPDDKDHNLHLNDAINLDIIMLKSQRGTPFIDNINLIIENEFNAQERVEDVSKNLLNIGGRIGNLMDVAEKALDPDSPDGIEISTKEKDNIYRAISEVEEKIAKLKLSIK